MLLQYDVTLLTPLHVLSQNQSDVCALGETCNVFNDRTTHNELVILIPLILLAVTFITVKICNVTLK
jgi:hypothetical protein